MIAGVLLALGRRRLVVVRARAAAARPDRRHRRARSPPATSPAASSPADRAHRGRPPRARAQRDARAARAGVRRARRRARTGCASFLADASHELRTPLASIRGYAELFRIGAAREPEDTEKAMRRIEDEAARMGVLVEDLLTLARLDEVARRPRASRSTSPSSRATPSTTRARPRPTARSTVDADGPRARARRLRTSCARCSPTWCATRSCTRRRARRSRSASTRDGRRGRGSRCATTAPACPTGDADALFERFWRAEGGPRARPRGRRARPGDRRRDRRGARRPGQRAQRPRRRRGVRGPAAAVGGAGPAGGLTGALARERPWATDRRGRRPVSEVAGPDQHKAPSGRSFVAGGGLLPSDQHNPPGASMEPTDGGLCWWSAVRSDWSRPDEWFRVRAPWTAASEGGGWAPALAARAGGTTLPALTSGSRVEGCSPLAGTTLPASRSRRRTECCAGGPVPQRAAPCGRTAEAHVDIAWPVASPPSRRRGARPCHLAASPRPSPAGVSAGAHAARTGPTADGQGRRSRFTTAVSLPWTTETAIRTGRRTRSLSRPGG